MMDSFVAYIVKQKRKYFGSDPTYLLAVPDFWKKMDLFNAQIQEVVGVS